ncbi:hypothetical protein [Xenorhabdus lircayensis]|uniref:hypothetical protein n=1 Tax=Xenorhabdus lircayensis TaxID=2763499 RepID=UPI001E3B522B|nr:hypothetical protein [Xenorhabdus lircayensis]
MIDPMQNAITFPKGWFLMLNGNTPFYCDQGCTVPDFADAGNLVGYNKKMEFTSNSPMNPPKLKGANLSPESIF